jgi:hypothetical protein
MLHLGKAHFLAHLEDLNPGTEGKEEVEEVTLGYRRASGQASGEAQKVGTRNDRREEKTEKAGECGRTTLEVAGGSGKNSCLGVSERELAERTIGEGEEEKKVLGKLSEEGESSEEFSEVEDEGFFKNFFAGVSGTPVLVLSAGE